ncbi:MAG: hypothetical protein JST92_06190, partial [Deltaproteobacteria bacterium]|nr:hypothetical protein [Deltaproteobacteria bacterium]
MADPKSRALERGRELEKAGRLTEAVAAFREAGAVEDAARVLAANKRVPDAVQLLMSSLGNVRPSQVGQLDAQGKKRALMAAILLVRNGEIPQAVELFLALGERARAVEALQRSGDTVGASRILSGQTLSGTSLLQQQKASAVGGQAETPEAARKLEAQGKMDAALDMWVRLRKFAEGARVARALGRLGDAAQMYAEAGQPVDAAWCYRQLGDTGKALENLVRVPRSDPRYRASAMEAVSLASELKVLNLALEQFVGEFVRTGPLSDHELPAFDKLARLYLAHDFLANAKEALQKLAARAPNYQDAFTRLKALEHEARATPMSAARVLADEEKRRRAKVEPLELPPLDDLPPLHDAALLLGDAPAPFEELEPIEDDGTVADAHGPMHTEAPTLHIHELPDDAIEAIAPVVSAPPPQRAPQGPPQRPQQAPQAAAPGKLQPVFQRHKPPPTDPTMVSAPPEPVGRPLPTPPPRLKPIALEGIPTPPPVQVVPQIQGEPLLELRSKPPPPTSPIPPKAEASFTPGALVAGRYRLEERIGTGGMAAVFRATDQELDEQVALKVFTLAEASDVA